jgi:hypothetical protein
MIWPGLAVIVTVAMMLFERRGSSRAEPLDPVHYGHSNVGDHEYDNLPNTSSGAIESDARPTHAMTKLDVYLKDWIPQRVIWQRLRRWARQSRVLAHALPIALTVLFLIVVGFELWNLVYYGPAQPI